MVYQFIKKGTTDMANNNRTAAAANHAPTRLVPRIQENEEETRNEQEQETETNAEQPRRMSVKANYMEITAEPTIFTNGKPKDFEVFTTEGECRIYGQIHKIDGYGLFIGTSRAQNELGKVKIPDGMPVFKAADLRDLATMATELADILEGKI